MALDPGDASASTGMSKDIFDAMDAALKDGIPTAQLPDVRKGWKKLSAAIAHGVINHLKSNLDVEVAGIQASGTTADGKAVTTTQTGSVKGQVS